MSQTYGFIKRVVTESKMIGFIVKEVLIVVRINERRRAALHSVSMGRLCYWLVCSLWRVLLRRIC